MNRSDGPLSSQEFERDRWDDGWDDTQLTLPRPETPTLLTWREPPGLYNSDIVGIIPTNLYIGYQNPVGNL